MGLAEVIISDLADYNFTFHSPDIYAKAYLKYDSLLQIRFSRADFGEDLTETDDWVFEKFLEDTVNYYLDNYPCKYYVDTSSINIQVDSLDDNSFYADSFVDSVEIMFRINIYFEDRS